MGPILPFELSIGCCNILLEAISTRGIEDDRACFGSTFGKYIYVRLIETVENFMQSVPRSSRG